MHLVSWLWLHLKTDFLLIRFWDLPLARKTKAERHSGINASVAKIMVMMLVIYTKRPNWEAILRTSNSIPLFFKLGFKWENFISKTTHTSLSRCIGECITFRWFLGLLVCNMPSHSSHHLYYPLLHKAVFLVMPVFDPQAISTHSLTHWLFLN